MADTMDLDTTDTTPSQTQQDDKGLDDETAMDMLLGTDKKLVVLPGHSSHAVSFQIEREDHTLGNSLRYFINKNPDVEFCGYTIPHPSETKMNIRIQTWGEWCMCHDPDEGFEGL